MPRFEKQPSSARYVRRLPVGMRVETQVVGSVPAQVAREGVPDVHILCFGQVVKWNIVHAVKEG
jgi:SpoU rRNA methylase family enzyme